MADQHVDSVKEKIEIWESNFWLILVLPEGIGLFL